MMKMRANIITQRKHIMNSRETLILKTLQCKALHSWANTNEQVCLTRTMTPWR